MSEYPTENNLSASIAQSSEMNNAGLGVNPQEQAFIESQKLAMQQPTEIGPQSNADLFPGAGHNINVGSQSGAVVGNNPIFVPGGDVYGFNLDLAQKQQDEAARIARNKLDSNKGAFKKRKAPELDDKFFQKNIIKETDALASKFTKDAYEIYGEDAGYVLENPQEFNIGREYIQGMDSYDLLVEQGNQMTTMIGEMQQAIDDGTKVYSDEVLSDLNDYENMMGKYASGDPKALIGMRDMVSKIQGGKNMDDYFHTKGVLAKIKPEILKRTSISDSKDIPDYATLTTTDKKIYDDNISNLVEGWIAPGGAFRGELLDGLVTKESMTKKLRGYLRNESESSKDIKDIGDSSSSGSNKIADLNGLVGEPNTKIFKSPTGEDSRYLMDKEIKLNTSGKTLANSGGMKLIAPNGELSPLTGAQNVKVMSLNSLHPDGRDSDDESQNIPVAIIEYKTEEKVQIGLERDKPVYEMQEVTKQAVVLYDPTMAKSIDADAKNLKLEKDYGTAALDNLTRVEKKEEKSNQEDPLGLGI